MSNSGTPEGAWALIADGEKALFLENVGDAQDANPRVLKKEEQENPKAQEWVVNKPDRFNADPSVHRSAVDDTDWHRLEKVRFAKDLAEKLYKNALRDNFDRLIIAASRPVLSS